MRGIDRFRFGRIFFALKNREYDHRADRQKFALPILGRRLRSEELASAE